MSEFHLPTADCLLTRDNTGRLPSQLELRALRFLRATRLAVDKELTQVVKNRFGYNLSRFAVVSRMVIAWFWYVLSVLS